MNILSLLTIKEEEIFDPEELLAPKLNQENTIP